MFGKKVECGYCHKKVRSVDKLNLCPSCEQYIQPMIGRHFEIIDESYKIIMSTRSVKTLDSRVAVIKDNVDKIVEYRNRGVYILPEMEAYILKALKDIEDYGVRLHIHDTIEKANKKNRKKKPKA